MQDTSSNQMHRWTLHVETAAGQPVTDAVVKVDGDMPQHGHGLPTRPRVTRSLGCGDYLVEGMKFQMGGWWVMEFTVSSGGRSDVAKFRASSSRMPFRWGRAWAPPTGAR